MRQDLTGARLRLELTPVRDLDALATPWRALEAEAAPSFFQSWTWVGCLAAERFADPLLLRVMRDDRVVGLALFNRRRGPLGRELLWLNQSGDEALDAVFVEHNGVLLARDATDLLPTCLRLLLSDIAAPTRRHRRCRRPWGVRLRLGGVDADHLLAAQQAGRVLLVRQSGAPYVDLTALPPGHEGYLATLSSNTRYQLRRSDRCFSRLGPLRVQQADTVAEALEALDDLVRLHQASWAARGQPGAFDNPAFLHFHRSLVARGVPRREVELLRITAGSQVLGFLYNFRLDGRVLTYQSGFDYLLARRLAGSHAKPGLSCHHAAILHARATGATVYDFLAGPDRFKRSLAGQQRQLYWLDLALPQSGEGLAIGLHNLARTPRLNSFARAEAPR